MAQELERLEVRISSNNRRFEQGWRRTEQVFTRGARSVEARAAKLDKRISNVGGSFGSAKEVRRGLAGIGLQLQDIAVQAEQGTDRLRIFTQQVPQVAGAFGPAGAAIGAFLAVGGALTPVLGDMINRMFGIAGAAAPLKDSMEGVQKVMSTLNEASDLLTADMDELRKKFGENAEEVARLRVAIAQLAVADARRQFQELRGDVDQLVESYGQLAPDASTVRPDSLAVLERAFGDSLKAIQDEIGVTGAAVLDLNRAFGELGQAKTFEEQVAALEKINGLINTYGGGVDTLPPKLQDTLSEMFKIQVATREAEKAADDLETAFNTGADAAGGIVQQADLIAEAMRDAKIEAEAVTAALVEANRLFAARSRLLAQTNQVAGDDRLFGLPVEQSAAPVTDAQRDAARRFGQRRRRGGGGGRSRATRTDPFVTAQDRARGQIQAIQQRIELVGKEGIALDNLRAKQEAAALQEKLLAEAKKKTGSVSEENREQIQQIVGDYTEYANALALTNEAQRALEESQRAAADAAEEAKRKQDEFAESLTTTASNMLGVVANADSIEDALKRIGVQIAQLALQGIQGQGAGGALFQALGIGLSAASGGFSVSGGSSFSSAASSAASLAGLVLNAKGNAFNRGRVIKFANGGVVDRPTMFPMANATGLMGEAGPEAIMPLKRGPGGRLGVEASGGGASRIIVQLSPDLVGQILEQARGDAVSIAAAEGQRAEARAISGVAEMADRSPSYSKNFCG